MNSAKTSFYFCFCKKSVSRFIYQVSLSLTLAVLWLGVTTAVLAAEQRFTVYVDTDSSAATGCSVATVSGARAGVEAAFTAVVDTSSTPFRTLRLERQNCAAGILSTPSVYDATEIATESAGTFTGVSLWIPQSVFTAPTAQAFVASVNSTGDRDVTANFLLTARDLPAAQIVPVPLSPWLALLVALAVASVGLRARRAGHWLSVLGAVILVGSTATAIAIVVNGANISWTGRAAVLADAVDASPNADVGAIYAQHDASAVYVRIDADLRKDAGASTNTAPTISGLTATATLATPTTPLALVATVTDDGLPNPPAALALGWTTVSGPGTVTFARTNAASTSATFSTAGLYLIRLTANDSALSSSRDISVTVNAISAGNTAPVISNLPATATVNLPTNSLALTPTVTDDGLPAPASLAYAWTQISGPLAGAGGAFPVSFSANNTKNTTVSFDFAGVGNYVLRLTASDGALSGSADITVTVIDVAAGVPAFGALADRSVKVGETLSFVLSANDPNYKQALAYGLVSSPAGASLAGAGNARFSFTPTKSQVGNHTVNVNVADNSEPTALTAQKSFNITVVDANLPPKFTAASKMDGAVPSGGTFTRSLAATDPDSADTLTYSLVNGPTGMTVSAAGSLSWASGVITTTQSAIVKVADSAGNADFARFSVAIQASAAPVAANDLYSVQIGNSLNVPAAQGVLANDVDPAGLPLTATMQTNPSKGSVSAFNTDGSFSYLAPALPAPNTFNPMLVKQHQILDNSTNHSWQLVDLNADGHTDIVFNHLCFAVRGCITAFDIKNNVQLWTTDASADGCTLAWSGAPWSIAVGDLDDDGVPDVAMLGHCSVQNTPNDRIMAFNGRTGAMKWRSAILHDSIAVPFQIAGIANNSMLSIARLHSGEKPSVLLGRVAAGATTANINDGTYIAQCASIVATVPDGSAVFPAPVPHYYSCAGVIVLAGDTGTITKRMIQDAGNFGTESSNLWRGKSDTGFIFPAMALDFDGSGQNKIMMNGAVWNLDGTKFGTSKPSHTHAIAVGNFDETPDIEMVLMEQKPTGFSVVVKKADGRVLWSLPLPTINLGHLTVADIDGDGKPEILFSVALGSNEEIWAVDNRGRVRWIHSLPCLATGCQGFTFFSRRVTAFDLDGDGVAEVLFPYNSELRFLDGATGAVKGAAPILSTTSSYEAVARVADVDNDGHADVVLVSSGNYNCVINPACFANVMVFSNAAKQWRPTRKIDNQFAYFGANVNNDGTIPTAVPLPNNFASVSGNVFGSQPQMLTPIDPRLRDQTSFTYLANNGALSSAPATVKITIEPQNRPPKFTSTPPTRHNVTLNYQARAVDPDVGDTVTYAIEIQVNASGIPCAIAATTGIITCDRLDSADALILVSATDSFGAKALQTLRLQPSTTNCTVPNVAGQTQAAASAALVAAGCGVGEVSETSAAIPSGQVLSQSPIAASVILGGEAVALVVSTGPAPAPIPLLVGKAEPIALGALASAGFASQVSRQFSTTAPFGQVISQTPSAGTLLAPVATNPVSLVISAGTGLELSIAAPSLNGGRSTTIIPIATDVNGNPAAVPALTYVIAPKRLPYTGALPTLSGTTLATASDTRGWFIVTATDAANGRSASNEFSVTLPATTGGRTNGEVYAHFMTTLSDMETIARQLLVARQANDVPQMTTLLAQYVNRWRTVDVARLKLAVPMVVANGFVPEESALVAAGLSPTPEDLLLQQVLRDASADLQAWTAALKAGTQLPQLKAHSDQFALRAARSTGLGGSLYGAVMNNPESIQLLSHDIPEYYEAFTNELGVVVGLPRRVSKHANFNRVAPERAKQTLAELLVTQAVDAIKDEIVSRVNETYKNIKQFAVEQRNLAIYNAGIVAASIYLKQYLYMTDVTELVSGASLSFRVFNSPFSFIEVESATRRHHLYSTLVIGPTLLTDLNTGLTDLVEKFKSAFSYARDAATNPTRVKSTDDLFAIHDEFKDLVDGLITSGTDTYKKFAERLYQSPVELDNNCIFTSALPCKQLMYPDGIKSVFEYAPPPGFDGVLGIPGVILFLVQDQVSGQMFIKIAPFLPTPPEKK